MVFDKFKQITPDSMSKQSVLDTLTFDDSEYIISLTKLPKPSDKKWLVVLSETAAVILIIIAITLWAILGRGLRDNSNIASHTDKPTYYVMVDEFEVIEGKSELQKFFDDYMNSKACKLDIFNVVSIDENGVKSGCSTVYNMNEDGSGSVYSMAANDGTYTAYDNALYIDENYHNSPRNPEVTNTLQFSFFENEIDYISHTSYGYVTSKWLDLSFMQNNYRNSDIIYDYDKADAVRIENGTITSGKEELFRFIRLYNNGNAAFLKIEGDEQMFIERSSSSSRMTCFTDTDEQHGLVLYMETDVLNGTVKIQLKEEHVLGTLYKEIVTLDFNEVYDRGLFFDDLYLQDGFEYLYGDINLISQMENNKKVVQMLKVTPPEFTNDVLYEKDHDMLIYFESGLKMFLYKNENGEYLSTVGLRFPLYMSEHVQAATLNQEVLQTIIDGLDKDESETDTGSAKDDHLVVYNNNEIIEGKDIFQNFFDDYVSGKECTLKLKEAVSDGNDLYFTIEAKADGSVKFYGDTDPYYNYETALDKYECDGMRFILLEGITQISRIAFSSKDGAFDSFTNNYELGFLKNDHPNSDRVYDHKKAVGGTLDEFKSFAKLYFAGVPCVYKFNKSGMAVFDGQHVKYSDSKNGIYHEKCTVIWEENNGQYDFYLNMESSGDRVTMIAGVDKITAYDLGIIDNVETEQQGGDINE